MINSHNVICIHIDILRINTTKYIYNFEHIFFSVTIPTDINNIVFPYI